MKPLASLSILAFVVATAGAPPATAHEGHHHTAMGTVEAIAAATLYLETQDGAVERFFLDEETTYRRGKAPATRHDVTVGERAAVRYELKDGGKLALEVKLAARTGSPPP